VSDVADLFEKEGFEITHPWWDYEGEGEHHEPLEFLQNCAHKDLAGILTADLVVVVNSVLSEGKAVEQGIAMTAGIPICLIGRKCLNIFQNMDRFDKVDTPEEAVEWAKRKVDEICQSN
jgi:nucleoside 2-deoxyribosyltransferase